MLYLFKVEDVLQIRAIDEEEAHIILNNPEFQQENNTNLRERKISMISYKEEDTRIVYIHKHDECTIDAVHSHDDIAV